MSFTEPSWLNVLEKRSRRLRLISEFSSFNSAELVCELSLTSETADFDPAGSATVEEPGETSAPTPDPSPEGPATEDPDPEGPAVVSPEGPPPVAPEGPVSVVSPEGPVAVEGLDAVTGCCLKECESQIINFSCEHL